MERAPEHMLSDLGRKLDDDVTAAVRLTTGLLGNEADCAVVTILGAARMLGMAVTFFERSMPGAFTEEQLVDALWASRLRPTVLSAIGGGSLRRLLADAEGSC